MKRVGCLVPYTNYTVEYELQNLFESGFISTEDVCFHFSKLMATTKYNNNEKIYLAQLNESIHSTLEQLKCLELDGNAFFCTSAGLINNIPNYHMISALTSLMKACSAVNMTHCMLITPYTQGIGEEIEKKLKENAITVTMAKHLDLRNSKEYYNFGKDLLKDFIKKIYRADYGNIVISCTNLPTFHIIEKLETDLNTTIITSNQGIIWDMLSTFQIVHKNYGLGSLFRR